MDRSAFYAALRKRGSGVFGTTISKSQVAGMEGILDAFASHGDGRDKTLAYALATTYHETGRRMVPVREGFAATDAAARKAVAKREYGKSAGKYNFVYYGRGHVQLTWLENYDKSSKDAGYDLVAYPDKMLDPIISARVLIKGLLDGRWNGKGRGIAFYLPDDGPDDLKNARRTVNILDKWELIAGYYKAFYSAIVAAGGVSAAKIIEERTVRASPDVALVPTVQVVPATSKTDSITLRVVQERLKELGYTEVGNPDGRKGKLTDTAILSFRSEHGLALSSEIDDMLLSALDAAKPRDLPRNDATALQVRSAAPEVKANWLTKITTGVGAGGLGLGAIGDVAGKADAVRGFIGPWKEMFADIPSWIWLASGAVLLGSICFVALRGEKAGVEAYQSGERR
jgi:hypothetical protein